MTANDNKSHLSLLNELEDEYSKNYHFTNYIVYYISS